MKILWIHGKSSRPKIGWTWPIRIEDLQSRWYKIDLPQFDPCEDPTYELWEKDMSLIDIESYDVIIASSHGSWVFARFVKENNIHIKRAIFCCPGRSTHRFRNTGKLYDYLESHEMNLKNNIDEIFIIHSTDDKVVPYSEWIKFQKQIWWNLVTVEWLWHKLDGTWVRIINDLATLWRIQKK